MVKQLKVHLKFFENGYIYVHVKYYTIMNYYLKFKNFIEILNIRSFVFTRSGYNGQMTFEMSRRNSSIYVRTLVKQKSNHFH